MKKIFYILMIILLMLTLVACSQTVVAPEETRVEVQVDVETEVEISEHIIEEKIIELQIGETEIEEMDVFISDELVIDEPTIESVDVPVIDEVVILEPQTLEPAKSVDYIAPVSGIAGKATLLNLLATAFEPVGTTLYIYGGGWNYEDTGGSELTSGIGIAQTWVDFFYEQDANFVYRDDNNKSVSYYPYDGKNTYYELGLDCSAYIGWVVYNTLHSVDLEADYVTSSTSMAKSLAENGFGTWTNSAVAQSDLQVGDIFSMQGHIWLCLGTCDDGSVVILHSTPSKSINGAAGGGVQLSAIGTDTSCQAYVLADSHMQSYYPEWSSRYTVQLKSYSEYGSLGGSSSSGRFSWDVDGVLSDFEGVANMSAEEILELLFG